jgi:hypothetical protein
VEDLLQFKCGVPPIRLLCARTFCDRQTSKKDSGGRQDQFVIESVVGPLLPPSVPQWALPHNYPHSMEAMLLFREGDGDTRYFCVVQKYDRIMRAEFSSRRSAARVSETRPATRRSCEPGIKEPQGSQGQKR